MPARGDVMTEGKRPAHAQYWTDCCNRRVPIKFLLWPSCVIAATSNRSRVLAVHWLAFGLIVLAVSSGTVIEDLTPAKVTTANVRDWLVVPIFYRTNRNIESGGEKFAYNEELNPKGASFGVKNIVVPAPENEPISSEAMEKLSWQ